MKRHNCYRPRLLFWASATCIVTAGALTVSAVAGGRESLRGPAPWDFPERNRETAFAYQYARDNASRIGAAAGIAGALGSGVVINSNTYAVGNWQQIEMTLGDGAEGLIMTENHQDNSGDTTAETQTLDDAVLFAEMNTESTASTRGGSRHSDGGGRKSGHTGQSGASDNHRSSGNGASRRDGERNHRSGSGGHRKVGDRHRGREKTQHGVTRVDQTSDRHQRDRAERASHSDNPCGFNGQNCWGSVEGAWN